MNDVIDEARFRGVLGRYPTGVTLITARSESGAPVGMVVGTFTSVSLDPPLVAFMPTRSSSSYARLRESDSFCANVLSARQEDVCRTFAVRGAHDKFAQIGFTDSPSGNPIIDGSVAWIDCAVERIIDAGDHDIVIGRIRDLGEGEGVLPMLFLGGGYGGFAPHSRVIPAATDVMQQLRLADIARERLERAANALGMECALAAPVEDSVVRIASAGSPEHPARPPRVGLRLPFEAPMGALLVAWAHSSVQERWVRRAVSGVHDAELAAYLDALTRVRERGWTLSLQTSAFERLDASIAQHSGAGERSVRVDDLHAVLNGPEAFAPDVDLAGTHSYRVRNLSVPIFDGEDVVMYLSAFGFGDITPAPKIRDALHRLSEVAQQVSQDIAASREEPGDA